MARVLTVCALPTWGVGKGDLDGLALGRKSEVGCWWPCCCAVCCDRSVTWDVGDVEEEELSVASCGRIRMRGGIGCLGVYAIHSC